MRPSFRSSLWIVGAVAALFTAGCSIDVSTPDVEIGDQSRGDLGKLRFEISSSDCLLGCALDKPALQGSLVTVIASNVAPDAHAKARLVGGGRSSIVDQRESCSDERTCSLSVDIEVDDASDPKLEIVTGNEVEDRVTVRVRSAARIETSVTAGDRPLTPEGDGIYRVRPGEHIRLRSRVFTVDGTETVFTKHGVTHEYGNTKVVRSAGEAILGSTNVEDMIAVDAGEATVLVNAVGAQSFARFRVGP